MKYRSGGEEKTLAVAVWYPASAAPRAHVYGGRAGGEVALDAEPAVKGGPYPLLVFSHGYGGGGVSSVFFTERLAARGWIVAAPDHGDRDAAVRIRGGRAADLDRAGFLRRAAALAASGPDDRGPYLYRVDELKAALDGMLASEPFGKLIDADKIAVGGHSFGGFTALGLCGPLEGRLDPRIKALLLFSSGAAGYLYREAELKAVKVPSMYFLGEDEKKRKRGEKDMAALAAKVYGSFPAPKYFLEIKGAGHLSFNNCFNASRAACRSLGGSEEQFETIRRYAAVFLDKHAAGRGDPSGELERGGPLVTRYLREPAAAAGGKRPAGY